jgi:glycosyltransferase involved in cell wall biosynthesis
MPRLRCSVVIPARNRADSLRLVLLSLEQQTEGWEGHEIVVVDDGSTDDTAATARAFSGRLPVVCVHRDNAGGFEAAQARNIGAQNVSGDIIIFLDSDVIVPAHFLARHLAYHRDRSHTCVVGSVVYVSEEMSVPVPSDTAGRAVLDGHPDPLENLPIYLSERIGCAPYAWLLVHSGNLSVPRDLFWRVGGFDEEFSTWSIEDLDLGWRLQEGGARFVFSRRAFGYHHSHPSLPVEVKRQTVRDGFKYLMDKYPSSAARIREAATFWEEEASGHSALVSDGRMATRASRLRRFQRLAGMTQACAEPRLTLGLIAWESADAGPLGRTLRALESCAGEASFEVLAVDAATGPGSEEVEGLLQLYEGPLFLRAFSTDWGVQRASLTGTGIMLRLARRHAGPAAAAVLEDVESQLVSAGHAFRQEVDEWIRSRAWGRVVRYLQPGDQPGRGWVTYIERLLEVT